MIIDSHCHLNLAAFDADCEEVIKRTRDSKVGVINVGTNFETSLKAINLAKNYDGFWATVGLHPNHTFPFKKDPQELGGGLEILEPEDFDEKFLELIKSEKVVAIGECGLDYSYFSDEEPVLQEKYIQDEKEAFIKQLKAARQFNKPLIFHVRKVYKEALSLIKEIYPEAKGVFHFFTGSKQDAREIIRSGFYIGLSGVITYTESYDQMIKELPLERILIETDAPYAAPLPFRGQRNEPIYVRYVAEKIAKIKGLEAKEVINQSLRNSLMLFNLNNYPLVDSLKEEV